MPEEPAFLGQPIQVRCRVQRVAVSPDGTGAERFEHNEDHVGRALGLDAVRLYRLLTEEVQPLRVAVADTQVVSHHRVMLTGGRLIEGAGFKREGVEQKQRRIKAQRRHLAVAAEEGIAPAQRHRVLQVQRRGAAEQAKKHQHAHHRRAAKSRQHANTLRWRPIQGGTLQAQQRPGPQRHTSQPGQGDP